MTSKEAFRKVLTVEWKAGICNQGAECWCRTIVPKEKIEYGDGEEMYIAASGTLPASFANHIVRLHNESLKQKL